MPNPNQTLHPVTTDRHASWKRKQILTRLRDKIFQLLDPYKESYNFIKAGVKNFQLYRAAEKQNHAKIQKYLASPLVEPNPALRIAIAKNDLRAVQILLNDPRITPEDPHQSNLSVGSAFELAAANRNIGIIKVLLKDGRMDPSICTLSANQRNGALIMAIINDDLDIVDALLNDPRVDPSAEDNFAVTFALSGRQDEIARRLLQDPRTDFEMAFYLAVRVMRLSIVKEMIQENQLTIDDYKKAWVGNMEEIINLRDRLRSTAPDVDPDLDNERLGRLLITELLGAGMFLTDKTTYEAAKPHNRVALDVSPYIALLLPFPLEIKSLFIIAHDMYASKPYKQWKKTLLPLLQLPPQEALAYIDHIASEIEGAYETTEQHFGKQIKEELEELELENLPFLQEPQSSFSQRVRASKEEVMQRR